MLLVVCCLIIMPNNGFADLKVVAEPGADPAHVEMVQKTVSVFNDILSVDMGVTLNRDVKIFVCPTRESYSMVLQRELGQSFDVAERNSKVTGGFSGGQSNAIAIKFDLSNGTSAGWQAYKTTAHELFHQVQYQLTGKNMGKSFYWMKEGTADLIGATIAEKEGYQSLEKWKLDQVNLLRKAESHVLPQEILITDLRRWTTMIENKKYPYEMSDLMVFYLMKQTEPRDYRAIADYYRLVGQGIENDEAFEKTFGMTSAKMIARFQVWFNEISTHSASIEIIDSNANVGAGHDDFVQGADLSRKFFIDNWGRDIQSSMRFVLASDKQEYGALMVKEFGIGAAEAEQRARNSTWWYSGSTTIYDMGSLTTKRQRVFAISTSLTTRFAYEVAPQKDLDQLIWLVKGFSDVIASQIVDRSGAYTMEQYHNDWAITIDKASMFPNLGELNAGLSWNQASSKYGSTVTRRTADLAGLYLLEKYGASSFSNWCKAVKETGNAELSFQQVFGMTTAQFYEEFSSYLVKNVKHAS